MLKTASILALLTIAASAAAAGADPDLLVGSVRDDSGAAVPGAEVRAFDRSGHVVGNGLIESDGTFAIFPQAAPQEIEVRCFHCRTQRATVAGVSNVVVIVRRYAALVSDVPSPADLAALPYGRIADDLGLMPFVVPGSGGSEISDRSLAGGRGLIVDSGVPLVDFATGSSALVDFPDRYVQSISLTGPEQAFRYGSYAGGGIFALAPGSDSTSYGAVDSGAAPSIAIEPSIDGVHPAYGESNDDGVLSRRADLGVTTKFAGGTLNASAGSAGERIAYDGDSDALSRSADLFHLGYATVSRRYRSFADLSGADVSVFDDLALRNEYRSSYVSADAGIEHPGPIALSLGALTTRQTAYAAEYEPLAGRSYDETAYVAARTGTEHAGAYAGLGLSDVAVLESIGSASSDGARLALVPSLGGRVPIGPGGLYARAGYSESLRVPTLLESSVTPSPRNGAPLERDELAQSALGFDSGGRVRAEAIGYREDVQGFDQRRQFGIGASIVWQATPRIAVRAWTLRATPDDYLASSYAPPSQSQTSRQVMWASYANGDGLRFDAIVHRDIELGSDGAGLDADAYLPLTHVAALDLGTVKTVGQRRYYVGLRTR